MNRQLQKKLFQHLFAAWLALSIVIGGFVYYWEMGQVDKWVTGMAFDEMKKFVENSIEPGDLHQQSREKLLTRMKEMTRENFIIAELYDTNGTKYMEVVRDGSRDVEEKLKIRGHTKPTGHDIWYEKQRIDEGLFLQVFVPIISNNNESIGSFEGVYRLNEQVLAKIDRQVWLSLLMVVVIVLVVTVALYPIFLTLNQDLVKYSKGLLNANLEVLEVLGGAIAKRDSDTNSHNYRVTIYTICLAEALGIASAQIANLIKGAFLHDVGKIGISDTILLKKGKLSDEEFAIMKTHTSHGIDIIKQSSWLATSAEILRYHHEKYDGSGYMEGLRGDEIPLAARVFAIVDVFDALTSERPYKDAFTLEDSLKIMMEGSGKHFDPEILQKFILIAEELHKEFRSASDEKLEQELGVLINRYF